ncbi:RNA polymerase subunit sigma-70 [Nostoc sp. 'Peltigera membranacea cyanobiont' 213]|uniref:sigma-70 family RNA polymerase sigma factor n=1 Tax=Nostoc sp. 'Peltigera membranacea cyanobiont' 213 TaxID=2014530 RepID=UPI000B950E38|nr:sigma-70 family RNA polymerase sigma factor [Nostoc sp. 'Peltigera membranacea cyanobiont' 213]OYD88249.1 RNA polymerase subunit sigma-70 [Nostoc sp. 'Peltigera membranacea cyanobiont' 213]
MRPRQQIIEMFSTFIELEGDRFSKWLIDIKLYRNIQNCLEYSALNPNSENFLALHWHKCWREESNSIAIMHLSAYLQESNYWAAKKTIAKFTNSQHSLADYFQMANAEIETILKNFNIEKCSSLKAYATMAVPSRLKDILRQRKEADICTNWALLRKVSKKQLLEALAQAGLSPILIAQYRLAWTCFKELYVQNQPGGTKSLLQPEPQLWEAIVNLYNRERQNQLTQPTPQCTREKIEQWLTQAAIYVRGYLYPPVSSLNLAISEDDSTTTFDLPDPFSDSLIAQMIAQEDAQNQQNQQSQIEAFLLKTLQTFEAKSQEILKLYYQQGLTQPQIVERLQMSQPTVSRRLLKARELMLAALIQWSQDTLNISVTSNLVNDMSSALEEWLKVKYGESS